MIKIQVVSLDFYQKIAILVEIMEHSIFSQS